MKKVFILFLGLSFGSLEAAVDSRLTLVALELAKDMRDRVKKRGFPESMQRELISATTQHDIHNALQDLCAGPHGPEIQTFLTTTAGVILLRRLPDIGNILEYQESRALNRAYKTLKGSSPKAAAELEEWGMWPLKRRY